MEAKKKTTCFPPLKEGLPGGTTLSNQLMLADLSRSGLQLHDLQALPLGIPERSALDIPTGVPGYVIPYFDIDGLPTPFYRARLFDFAQKYRQPRGAGNQVYFPPNFRRVLNGHPYVIITEGEKKAASATTRGFPTVSLGGVYSWRNKSVTLPDNAVVSQGGKARKGSAPVDLAVSQANRLQIKLPEEFDADKLMSEYAQGFEALIQLVKLKGITVLIAFDSNREGVLDYDIQKAAARLAMELRFMGVAFTKIRQLTLPNPNPEDIDKVGLDDYLGSTSPLHLEGLINRVMLEGKFPAHPNMHQFVSKKLQNPKLGRKEVGLVGLSIIADLDTHGRRLKSADGLMYYFDSRRKQLIRASAPVSRGPVLLDDGFNSLLYKNYSLTTNDAKIQRQISAQFVGEEPVEDVVPRRTMFMKNDTLHFQISNSQFITCDVKHPCRVLDNGSEGTLFQSVMEHELDPVRLQKEVATQLQYYLKHKRLDPWWYDTLRQTRLKGLDVSDLPARMTALLFYVSPWLFRWRNTQLPVEIATGEAGSGKSTLYGLRQTMLAGMADLKNTPNTIRDWHASIASGGGLHVIDNMNLTVNKGLKQELSDEMCRIVTEPSPTIEMRKFYTEHELVKVPINAVFAMTAINLPFHQSDLIQRSYHIELDKGTGGVQYDTAWAAHQLENRGGREAWVAHHLVVLHLFFAAAQVRWDNNFKATYRLINFEQACRMVASLFGWEGDWITLHLAHKVGETVKGADWVVEGLKAYCDHVRDSMAANGGDISKVRVTSASIADWAASDDEFKDCIPLTNSRKLGRYLTQHRSIVSGICGLHDAGVRQNKTVYRLV